MLPYLAFPEIITTPENYIYRMPGGWVGEGSRRKVYRFHLHTEPEEC